MTQSGRISRRACFALVGAPLAIALVLGALWGFPVFDDAYYLMALREGFVGDLPANHLDRPVYGALLEGSARLFRRNAAVYAALAAACWLLLAWQTHRLWRRLFPGREDLSLVAAALVFSPLLVDLQYTTLTTILPVTLPVILALAGLLIVLRREGRTPWPQRVLAAALMAVSVLLSEYGIAATAASVALLLGLRRWRSATAMAIGASVGYAAFRLMADISDRPKVDAWLRLRQAIDSAWGSLSLWLSGLAYTLAGAYGKAISELRLLSDSKGTWIAAGAGLLVAVGVAFWLRSTGSASASGGPGAEPRRPSPLAALLLAVGAGLGVVVLANTSPLSPDPYRSRYRLPAAPFAVLATVAVLDRAVRPRSRRAVFAGLAFLAGWRMVDGAFQVRREQQLMESVGRRILPLVRESEALVVAVIPDQHALRATDLTPKVTRRWTDAESLRVLVLSNAEGEELFGSRATCRSPERIDVPLKRVSSRRTGMLSRLVYVPIQNGKLSDPEPYCPPPPP